MNRYGTDLLEYLDETTEDLSAWTYDDGDDARRARARDERAARAELRPRTGLVEASPIDPPVS